jgi:hypothetical protein
MGGGNLICAQEYCGKPAITFFSYPNHYVEFLVKFFNEEIEGHCYDPTVITGPKTFHIQ